MTPDQMRAFVRGEIAAQGADREASGSGDRLAARRYSQTS